VPFFFVGGPDASSSFILKNIWNFGHIFFFAVLMLLIQSFKPLVHWQQWLLVSIVAIAIGGVIEFFQHFVGRNASVDDVLHNVYGVWLGLFWGQKPTRLVWLLRVAGVLLIAPPMWLVIDSGFAHIAMRNQFPQLNSFESRHELQQLQPNTAQLKLNQTQRLHTHGVHAAHIMLDTHPYSGVSLVGNYGDWGGYAALLMDLYNPDPEPLALVVRISDYQHDRGTNNFNDRFNRRILLMQGWNQVQIDLNEVHTAPLNRVMQMDAIGNITIFAPRSSNPREFYLDNVRLQ
jgi:hypothetical protein